METNNDILNKPVGTAEGMSKLSPKPVVIVNAQLKDVLGKVGSVNAGKKVAEKVIFMVRHPDREELATINQCTVLQNKSLKNCTMFVNLDKDENLQKDSPLALLLKKHNAKTIKEMEGKTVATEQDGAGYLSLAGY